MCTWQPYAGESSGRVFIEDARGFLVIVPEDSLDSEKIPISCPLCGCLFRSVLDEDAYQTFKSCDWCALNGIKTVHEAEERLKTRIRPQINVSV